MWKEFQVRNVDKYIRKKFCSNECRYAFHRKPNVIEVKEDHAEIIIHNKRGTVRALIDLDDINKVRDITWQAYFCKGTNQFYIASSRADIKNLKLHRFLMNCPDNLVVDHLNHNPLDNRKANLRICTPKDNARNCSLRKDNTSGYSGVRKPKGSEKWEVHYSNECYGRYDTLEEAVRVRQQVELRKVGFILSKWIPED